VDRIDDRHGRANRRAYPAAPLTATTAGAQRLAALVAACLAAALASCAVGPDFRRPPAPTAERTLPPGASDEVPAPAELAPRFGAASDVPADWWTRFQCQPLDALVRDAVDRSPNLRAATAALRASEDSLRAGYGVFLPQVGVAATAARQDTVTVVDRALVASGPYSLGTLSASVSYAPDLFGGQRRAVEQLGAKVDAQRYAYLAAWLALTTNVANTAIARSGYQAQREALADVIRMQQDQIRIAEVQFEAGTSSYAPVAALRSQRATNSATLATLDQRIDQSEHLLAQLEARAPADARLPAIRLDELVVPLDVPDSLPSALARRRPDILAAEASLHVASAQIGIATADLFPTLALSGSGGTAHGAIADLLRAGTRYWSLQASLAASVFNGGSTWYTRRAAIDAYDEALAVYEQTVLGALQQVADAMRALQHDAQVQDAQREAQVAADENLKLARANFEAGNAGYLDLLTADGQVQQARLGVAGAVAQRLQDTVALYAALGGGWWNGNPAGAGVMPADAVRDAREGR